MTNSGKNWQAYARKFLFVFFLAGITTLSATSTEPDCSCTAPAASMTGHTSNSASFSWSAVTSATEYQLWYVNKATSQSSSVSSTSNTSITLSGFPTGTYTVYIKTICGASVSTGYIIADDLVMM